MFDFDERHKGGAKTVLVNVELSDESSNEDLAELLMLAESAGAKVAGILTCARKVPDSRFFIGTGKTEELKALIADLEAEMVIFNHELTPSQERNLEKELGCKVIVRGLRAVTDFDFELQLAAANEHIDNEIETMFLMAASGKSFISSSLVKDFYLNKVDISKLVPPNVLEQFNKK